MAQAINDALHTAHSDMKPAYQAPAVTELDAGETASGIIPGTPENSTYS